MQDLINLKEMLCDELAEYGKRDTLTQNSLEMIDKLAHACKNICKIIEAYEQEEHGMSMDGRSYEGGGSGRSYEGGSGRSYGRSGYSSDGYYYDSGRSYRRGRGRNGRFVSRDGSEIARKLREMMEEAPDEATKSEIQRLADKMEQM